MRQALEMALEALETLMIERESIYDKAITAIKEALAQPEQEPVAYLSNKRQRINIEIKPQAFVEIPTVTDWEMPLYMKPPQRTWVDLTNEDWNEIFDTALNKVEAIKLTKAKLKERNT